MQPTLNACLCKATREKPTLPFPWKCKSDRGGRTLNSTLAKKISLKCTIFHCSLCCTKHISIIPRGKGPSTTAENLLHKYALKNFCVTPFFLGKTRKRKWMNRFFKNKRIWFPMGEVAIQNLSLQKKWKKREKKIHSGESSHRTNIFMPCEKRNKPWEKKRDRGWMCIGGCWLVAPLAFYFILLFGSSFSMKNIKTSIQ